MYPYILVSVCVCVCVCGLNERGESRTQHVCVSWGRVFLSVCMLGVLVSLCARLVMCVRASKGVVT